jgi:F-type H+-transporting ATPase subunit epsilon
VTLQVELVSPERVLYSGEAEMVICRTTGGGDIAFLTGHAPFIGALAIWPVRIKTSASDEEVAAVHGGFVEVRDDRVIILSDVAELADQIDVDRARRAKEHAEEQLRSQDDEAGQTGLERATVRLQVAEAST